jgi:hypothetical protein
MMAKNAIKSPMVNPITAFTKGRADPMTATLKVRIDAVIPAWKMFLMRMFWILMILAPIAMNITDIKILKVMIRRTIPDHASMVSNIS